jgi:hypothetical protein
VTTAIARRRGAPDPRLVLDELVYERVRLDADLRELGELERELADGFRRVLRELDAGASSDELGRLLDGAVARAYERVADEMLDEDLASCPHCTERDVA